MPTRDLNILNTPQAAAAAPAATTVGQQFSTQIADLLKRYQSMGTAGFARQGFDAQQAQASRVQQQTPQDLIGASPSMQSGVRSASAQAMNPTIQSAANSAQTFGEQLNSFGNSIQNARSLMQEYEASQERAKQGAQQTIMFALNSGGSAGLSALMQAQPELLKLAGYDSNTIAGIIPFLQQKEAMEKQAMQNQINQPITPYQQATLNQSQQQFQTGQQISPYQQSQIDLDKQRIAQSQTQFDANLKQEQNSPAAAPDIILTDDGIFRYDNGSLVSVPIKDQQQALSAASQTSQTSQPIDYTFHVGQETIDQYNQRIAAARAVKG